MELIDREALKAEWIESRDYSEKHNMETEFLFFATCIPMINLAPVVDAVPVVRCGECRHAHINSFSAMQGVALCKYWTNRSDGVQAVMPKDGFCSHGEPRTPPAE